MTRFWLILICAFIFSGISVGQTRPKATAIPSGVPVKDIGIEALGGRVEGRTYRNNRFSFDITVPDDWYIAGPDFEKIMREKGFDLSPNLPAGYAPQAQIRSGRAFRSIDILMTAFRSEPEAKDGALLRVTSEDLKPNPQIRDAVDYFDAIRAAYMTVKLPPDFSYSTTKAEQLGPKQFGYLDTSARAGKKRMYATVRNGHAIMFTLSYTRDEDLQTLKHILATANFGN